ncbi:hypothetical protein QNI19_26180 [Cytophagaceae bacterium DM2B3-1]|uniref:Uncharacterized protein n=1 Tax=Xanthocytophaga flava TaxID=3048013 RepID=A0ABT7CRY8_9BACT|nr:hypothetical protein [Xanthocytophaga flavus]MDJ1496451.1 hypothetical protein [Xanthocytophaga flavus]
MTTHKNTPDKRITMGLFKRIFGKGDAEQDKRVNNEVEQIKSGQITKIYPILKPGDWVGIQAGALKQTLLGTQEQPELVVAFGYDAPTNFVFLMPNDLEGKDPGQVLTSAYENLEAIESPFEFIGSLANQALAASGNDFSSEKILCQSHMRKAHKLLQAEELLVSIPRRTCMTIISRQADRDSLAKFAAIHNYTWQDDSYGNAPIINALFIVKDGLISGVISLDK